MLADIDDPPRSRMPGLMIGMALAIPVGAALVGWVIPMLVAAVLGGAHDLDANLREQDAYMQAVCTEALDVDRDQHLCGCALAAEVPSLDCQGPFRLWLVQRQTEVCTDPATHADALSFCTCIETLATAVAEADPDGAMAAAQPYDRCATLPDALAPPAVESL